jgi:glycosyltransferase involved in cell wall biosynthesis
LKVLLSALACEPGKGSEPEVGFRTLLAAASQHEVWVLTLPESARAIGQVLADDARASRIHFETIDFDMGGKRFAELTAPGFHVRYDRWQREASDRALQLDRTVGFNVVHHVTLASYWTRAGVAVLDKPLVWGPIGGGVNPPMRLLGELGPRGAVETLARFLGRPLIARLPPVRTTERVATITFVQNRATASRLRPAGKTKLLPNAFAVEVDEVPQPQRRNEDIVFVGRFLPWKAPTLAIRALQYVRHPEAMLRFFGDGPEQARMERAIRRWGLQDRVRFEGWIPRGELLPQVARAGVLIHPAVHEEAGLCIAEALSFGTPVVALDHGGPSEIIGQWGAAPGALVPPQGPEATARSLAAAIDRFLFDPPPVREHPLRSTTSFEAEVLRAYEVAAQGGPFRPT